MLQSMTGFGNASLDSEFGKISLDIKSLNSKTLDLTYNLNPIFRNIENDIRGILVNFLKRGKVDLKINFKISGGTLKSQLNHKVIRAYIKDLKKITPANDLELLKIAVKLPDSVSNNNTVLNRKLDNQIISLVKIAVKELVDFRIKEGNSLRTDLLSNIESIQEMLVKIEKLAPKRIQLVKEKIKKKLLDLKKEIDLNRFEQELIYYLEKIDINEELVRLKNHLMFFKKTVNEKRIEKGKKLSFISQEIGREINTIGSKSNYLLMQKIVVEMKNELEKIKEQLLNVL
tara:strand:- start:44 stop:904 length:861 start_codon:yes stop_codon:yes gene_type:complete